MYACSYVYEFKKLKIPGREHPGFIEDIKIVAKTDLMGTTVISL